MPDETPPIRGPEALRAIAHPVRLRLYEALLTGGPATGARLGHDVPAAPGSLSYHLRQLARHGFIEDAPELATDGRERVWRAIPGGAHWEEGDLDSSEGVREVATAAQLVFLGRQQERLRTWLRRDSARFGADWRSAAFAKDIVIYLNAEELTDLGNELDAFVDQWLTKSRSHRLKATAGRSTNDRRGQAPGTAGGEIESGRKEVMLVLHAFPFSLRDDSDTSLSAPPVTD